MLAVSFLHLILFFYCVISSQFRDHKFTFIIFPFHVLFFVFIYLYLHSFAPVLKKHSAALLTYLTQWFWLESEREIYCTTQYIHRFRFLQLQENAEKGKAIIHKFKAAMNVSQHADKFLYAAHFEGILYIE